ncbi:MAG TPA: hypothetical protein V6C76_10395 [Drouetiella sp.]
MQKPPLVPPSNSTKSVKLVWLLNLIPYTGAGLIYAMGLRCVPVLMVSWLILLTGHSFGTSVMVYIALSVIGSLHLKGTQADKDRLRHLRNSDNIISPDRGTQVPLARDREFWMHQHEAKMARKAHKKHHDDDDHSDHATDLFEAKAHAAELQLKARAQQDSESGSGTVNTDSGRVSTDSGSGNTDSEIGNTVAEIGNTDFGSDAADSGNESDALDFRPADAPTFSDETPQENPGKNIAASPAVAESQPRKDSAQDAKASTSSLDDPSFSRPFGDGLPAMDLSADSPSAVPDISSMMAASDSIVPDVSTQYSSDSLSLPSSEMTIDALAKANVSATAAAAASKNVSAPGDQSSIGGASSAPANNPIVAPDVSSQWQNTPIETPDVSSQWQNKPIETPDVSSQWQNKPIEIPDVSTEWQNKPIETPDVSTEWQNRPIETPDVSTVVSSSTSGEPAGSTSNQTNSFDFSHSNLGNFEIPKFEFSFSDPLQSTTASLSGGATEPAAGAVSDKCPKCGELKNSNFSFCLACGQTFT